MLKYKKMDLFSAPKGSILVHSCNAQGVWGSGIAKEFKERFPKSFDLYNKFCKSGINASGYGPVFKDRNYSVGCLITSFDFGLQVDSKDVILVNTVLALEGVASYRREGPFYSNKFNSGLFCVPWEETEKILKVFVDRYNLDWTVCDLNLEENR